MNKTIISQIKLTEKVRLLVNHSLLSLLYKLLFFKNRQKRCFLMISGSMSNKK